VTYRPTFSELIESLKKAAAALRDAGVTFVLGGGIASAARGGPESDHDVDLLLRPQDADPALAVLEEAGFKPEKPPEGWLYKAWDGEVFVDLIFRTSEGDVDDDLIERASELEVYAVPMLVLAPEDLVVSKLLALDEMVLDYKPILEIARALREQIDWSSVRERTSESPFAKAFFTLLEELAIVSEEEFAPR
jgi:predicted nucleotidyltransferase